MSAYQLIHLLICEILSTQDIEELRKPIIVGETVIVLRSIDSSKIQELDEFSSYFYRCGKIVKGDVVAAI